MLVLKRPNMSEQCHNFDAILLANNVGPCVMDVSKHTVVSQ